MIIKRKLFTRQEARAMKEIYEALKSGKVGRNLSAKDFVRARRVSNETVAALHYQDKEMIPDFVESSKVIESLGLPETSKAYQRMIEKYTNPEAHRRLKRIQDARSTSRLRKLRERKKNLEKQLGTYDYTTKSGKNNLGVWYGKDNIKAYNADKDTVSREYRDVLEEIEKIKKGRTGRNLRFNKKKLSDPHIKEDDVIRSSREEAIGEATAYKTGTKTKGAKKSWKIKTQLQKEGEKAKIDGDRGSYHVGNTGEIHVNRGYSRDPLTILHEFGHRLGSKRGEVAGEKFYYNSHVKLDPNSNSADNLARSLDNRIGNLVTLTEEANASYHAAARAKKYGISKKQLRRGKRNLSGAFKTYEQSTAQRMNYDDYIRKLGKSRNK